MHRFWIYSHRFPTMVSMCWQLESTSQDYDATTSIILEWSLSAVSIARLVACNLENITNLCRCRWQNSAFSARTIPRLYSCTVTDILNFTRKLAATTDWGMSNRKFNTIDKRRKLQKLNFAESPFLGETLPTTQQVQTFIWLEGEVRCTDSTWSRAGL